MSRAISVRRGRAHAPTAPIPRARAHQRLARVGHGHRAVVSPSTTSSAPQRQQKERGDRVMKRNHQLQAVAFEPMELRQLLATINVTDFGARPNDGGNDTGAIQAALNASKPGDTIRFAGGTFDLPSGLTIKGDRIYRGEGATLRGRHAEGWLFRSQSDNVTVQNLTFDGGGLFVERLGGGRPTNIVIDGNS